MAIVKTYRVICDDQHVVSVTADTVSVDSTTGAATFSRSGAIVAQFNTYQHFFEISTS